MSDPALTVQQAADTLGISRRMVRRYIESGRLPARRVEGEYIVTHYLIDSADLDAFAAHERPRGNPAWRSHQSTSKGNE